MKVNGSSVLYLKLANLLAFLTGVHWGTKWLLKRLIFFLGVRMNLPLTIGGIMGMLLFKNLLIIEHYIFDAVSYLSNLARILVINLFFASVIYAIRSLAWLYVSLPHDCKMRDNSSVIRQKGESQNACFKKTKYAKFSEKRTFLIPWYPHARTLKSHH